MTGAPEHNRDAAVIAGKFNQLPGMVPGPELIAELVNAINQIPGVSAMRMCDFELAVMAAAMVRLKGNRVHVASSLDIGRRTLQLALQDASTRGRLPAGLFAKAGDDNE